MVIKKIAYSIRIRLLPTRHQLMARRWRADGGDEVFRFSYDLGEDSVVLDIGGYEGQWASDLFARYGCHIFVFEPVPVFADRIRERFSHNERIGLYACGLAGRTRSETIHLSADGSSLYRKSGTPVVIELVDVKEWLDAHSITHIDLMKINTEGGEYELIDRLIETQLIRNVENIQVQFHNVTKGSRAHMMRIQEALAETHAPTYQYEFVWENWARIH